MSNMNRIKFAELFMEYYPDIIPIAGCIICTVNKSYMSCKECKLNKICSKIPDNLSKNDIDILKIQKPEYFI